MEKKRKILIVLFLVIILSSLIFLNVSAKPYTNNSFKMSPSVFSVYIPELDEYYSPSIVIPSMYSDYTNITIPFERDDDGLATARMEGFFSFGGLYNDDVVIGFDDLSEFGTGALTISSSGYLYIYSPSSNYLVTDVAVYYSSTVYSSLLNFASTAHSLSEYFYDEMYQLMYSHVLSWSDNYVLLFLGEFTVEGETAGYVDMYVDAGTPRVDENGNFPIQNYQYNNFVVGDPVDLFANGVYDTWYISNTNNIVVRPANVAIRGIDELFTLDDVFNTVSTFLNTPFFGIFTFGEVGAFILALSVLMVILKFAYGG